MAIHEDTYRCEWCGCILWADRGQWVEEVVCACGQKCCGDCSYEDEFCEDCWIEKRREENGKDS